ncbi:4-alpha-glucanotransferase [Motilimonas pumila]|uniref:4-alpha-glucanotransferase n=1 Tax=Motilimonas pumila TaxID=2303987 RepID=A0A418YFZ1_9GAMM|nr:4-alpha-glucanotransferase [Motilimonas pumila]RJG48440.1 4-alpha-glucanotransferase [Motilimonas pumila]
MSDTLLSSLAHIKGIDANYIDAWGNEAQVSPKVVSTILQAMGCDTSEQALPAQVEQALKQYWMAGLSASTLAYLDEPVQLELRLPIDFVNDPVSFQVNTETGEIIKGQITPIEGELQAIEHINEVEFQAYLITLPIELKAGYHDLILFEKHLEEPLASSRLIVAPRACFTPTSIQQGKKVWGVSVQLYGVRSENNWGIGDFGDLPELLAGIKGQGGDFVGLNPIHSLYPMMPENASPYSPSSREWLNIIYIDVNQVEEFSSSEDAQALYHSEDFQRDLAMARAAENVDYSTVNRLKLSALKLAYESFKPKLKGKSARVKSFKAFVKQHGDALQQQAGFDAIHEHLIAQDPHAWGWPVWAEEWQDFASPHVKKWLKANKDAVQFWAYLQWLADEQLNDADAKAKQLGMEIGIYRDLAVGVASGGCEIWANKSDYCSQATVGAPPDILGPLGQNWGLPPLDPAKLVENGFQAYINLLQANMKACGALRIDHVMALLRLWWVPAGDSADSGVYVYYPVEFMLAILALESQRQQCLIIGEDLGTVPDGMDVLLKDAGVYSYRVFCFEVAEDGGFISPSHYPTQAMATVVTHDMPTLTGFWHCEDLKLGLTLGLYKDQALVDELMADRHQAKQQMLNSLHGHHSIPDCISESVDVVGMDRGLSFGIQQHMAQTNSALLSLQLEDFLEMEKPVNVPGTSDEYPNWRRKLSTTLSDLFSQQHISELTQQISAARNQAAK